MHIECHVGRAATSQAGEALRAATERGEAHVLRRGSPRTQNIRALAPRYSADPYGPQIAEAQVMTNINQSGIPEKFFLRQDDLKSAAHVLANAGRTANPYQVAKASGGLSETCVRCHADYRPRD